MSDEMKGLVGVNSPDDLGDELRDADLDNVVVEEDDDGDDDKREEGGEDKVRIDEAQRESGKVV